VNASTGLVTIVGVGSTTVTATQAETDNYAARSATTTLTVGRGTPVIGNFTIATKQVGASNFTVTAPTSSSAGAFTYSIDDEPGKIESNIATIVNSATGEIDVVGAGSVQVRATQVANTLYVSTSITATFVVEAVTNSSCLDIKTQTGTNTNGEYTIALNVGGSVVNTQVYCLMDSAMDGGGWTMVMKSAQNSTTFNYSANYWTTANVLNETDASAALSDSKYNTFNYLAATNMLAVFPDININSFGSTERGSIDGHNYGWTWKQSVPSGPKTALGVFSGVDKQYVSLPAAFNGHNGTIFTEQEGFKWYGFNYPGGGHQLKVRWGFGWNNEGDEGSNDVSGGIGLSSRSYSAGDVFNCCRTSIGVNRSMAMQMYVR
jgi:hypothetical protein